jgi:hypothetical protein
MFIQRFVDEHAVDRVKILKNTEVNLRDKMSVMDWLARYSEFLSGDAISQCIEAFKEIFNTDNATLKNAYIYANTNSNVIQTVL